MQSLGNPNLLQRRRRISLTSLTVPLSSCAVPV
uniref:Uncharacterized protein n=1 Tax=Arundo donax TaxID=35708 RepID=A0A0A9AUP1_ARUDO